MSAPHDWPAAFAKPFRMPNGAAYVPPTCYMTPGVGFHTVCGGLVATLVVDACHVASDPVPYTDPLGKEGATRKLTPEKIDNIFAKAIGDIATRHRLPMSLIRSAVGEQPPAAAPVTVDCSECDGTGEVTCYSCGHDHACDECDGTGNATEYPDDEPLRFIRIEGNHFDARHLAPLLAIVPDGDVEVALTKPPTGNQFSSPNLVISGPDWRLVCAGYTLTGVKETDPVTEIPTRSAAPV